LNFFRAACPRRGVAASPETIDKALSARVADSGAQNEGPIWAQFARGEAKLQPFIRLGEKRMAQIRIALGGVTFEIYDFHGSS
jgi:hypothetical protein